MIKSSVFSQANKVRSATNKSVRQVAAKTQFKYVLVFCIILVLYTNSLTAMLLKYELQNKTSPEKNI